MSSLNVFLDTGTYWLSPAPSFSDPIAQMGMDPGSPQNDQSGYKTDPRLSYVDPYYGEILADFPVNIVRNFPVVAGKEVIPEPPTAALLALAFTGLLLARFTRMPGGYRRRLNDIHAGRRRRPV